MNREKQICVYGEIPKHWRIKKLKDLCIDPAGILTGPFGSQLHQKDYTDIGTPILTVEHLGDNRIIDEDIPRVSDKDRLRLIRYVLQSGDIVFSRVGSVDRRSIIKKEEEGWMFSGRCLRVRVNNEKISARYLSWFFGLPAFKEYIRNIAVGATMPSLNTSLLSNIDVIVPPVEEQIIISDILDCLQDKIQLNIKKNNKIEEILQFIFKKWFIDFEFPNQQRKPYKSSGGKMIDSELGEIPKGWEIKSIGEICFTYGGGTPSTKNPKFWNGTINWAVPSDLTKNNQLFLKETERKITEVGLDNCSSKLHPSNSILMTSRASIGFFSVNKVSIATNQGFIVIEPKREIDLYYLLNNFQSRVSEFIGNANGTTFLEISRGTFRKLPILIPTKEVLESFHILVNPLYEKIFINEKMIDCLTKIRDYLLPKLMSGEIRV